MYREVFVRKFHPLMTYAWCCRTASLAVSKVWVLAFLTVGLQLGARTFHVNSTNGILVKSAGFEKMRNMYDTPAPHLLLNRRKTNSAGSLSGPPPRCYRGVTCVTCTDLTLFDLQTDRIHLSGRLALIESTWMTETLHTSPLCVFHKRDRMPPSGLAMSARRLDDLWPKTANLDLGPEIGPQRSDLKLVW